MKPLVIAVSAMLFASLGIAGETTTQATTTAQDSPLVRAAKSTNRAKKRIVITEETLKSSTGHISTTKTQEPIAVLPPSVASQSAGTKAARCGGCEARVAKAAEAKKAETERKHQLERLAAEEGEGPYSEVDPAALEHQQERAAQTAPKEGPKKP